MEFYASTEGNSVINLSNKTGAIGYVPRLLRAIAAPNRIIKYDVEADAIVRDPKTGFCLLCKPGEAGEFISKIDDAATTTATSGGQFGGYTDPAATEKKIIRDVFEKGDKWFRTGDLIKQDREGYYYFVDRIGDTFRWKGENVATGEVAEVLNVLPGIDEANVYGVAIPGYEGRAGMAALVVNKDFAISELFTELQQHLPVYAQPLFLRISDTQIETTSTFKYLKSDAVKEGFNPQTIADPVYFRDESAKSYIRLTPQLYQGIVEGKVKV